MSFKPGQPNLSEAERARSPGAVVIYYADEDDSRTRWFSELDFFDMPWRETPEGEQVSFGDEWSAGEPVDITADHVRDWYAPRFLDAMRVTREALDEPPHLGYEVYWKGELVHQSMVELES